MSNSGKIVRHEITMVMNANVEIQVRQIGDDFYSEWSFDGHTWDWLQKKYRHPDDALALARSGAFLAQVHKNLRNRRDE